MTTMTPILSAFNLENFKSYRTGRLPLGPLTVLIGANASGKSNALEVRGPRVLGGEVLLSDRCVS